MPLDAQRLAELIDSQAAALRLWVRSRTAACDDVVQEAFCRLAVEHPAPVNPVAWLYLVCRNLASTERRSADRRSRREQARALHEAAAPTEDPLELAETVAAVEELEPALREILVARIWGHLSLEEVGKLCGVSTATAYRRYHAALEELRTRLDAKVEN